MTDTGGGRPPPASGAASFNKWLAGGVPSFVAGLLVARLADNLWFVLLGLGAAAAYGVAQAPTTAHGPLILRLLTPLLVLAYTAFLVVVAVDPDLPPAWQVTVPAALVAAAAFAAARSYGATGFDLTLGIAAIGLGIATILHHDLTLGSRSAASGSRSSASGP